MVCVAWRVAELGQPGVTVSVRANLNLLYQLVEWHKTCDIAPTLPQLIHVYFVDITDFLTAVVGTLTFIEVSPSGIASKAVHRAASALHRLLLEIIVSQLRVLHPPFRLWPHLSFRLSVKFHMKQLLAATLLLSLGEWWLIVLVN